MDTEHAQSVAARAEKVQGVGLPLAARTSVLLAALTLSAAAAAQVGPIGEDTGLRRHGSAARLLWVPDGASARLDSGKYLSAGLVLGTRGTARTAVGPVAPALVFEAGHRTSLTLMAVNGRGAILVWQRSE